jgi:hypothetical protein
LPYQNTALPESLLAQIAGLGGQGMMQGTSTVTQPMNPWTTGAGLGLGLLALGGGGNLFPSDARIKDDIQPIGILHNGLTVHRFRFKGSPRTEIGVMAQDVEKIKPEAVVNVGLWPGASVKMVDYQRATEPDSSSALAA